MPLKVIPATGGLGWAWCTPAWAATARPTISAVAAIVRTAVIHSRSRRVIATSFTRCVPGSGIIGGSKPRRRWTGAASRAGRLASDAPVGLLQLAHIGLAAVEPDPGGRGPAQRPERQFRRPAGDRDHRRAGLGGD